MSDTHMKIGQSLVENLLRMRKQKGTISAEDIGNVFMAMAAALPAGGMPPASPNTISSLTSHLDEVLRVTENASHSIMDAAEAIHQQAAGIGGSKEQHIAEATRRIYEACNFQDITGQRIKSVLKTLAGMKQRSDGHGRDGHILPIHMPADGKELLNGPQLPGQGVSQEEIDLFFANLSGKK